MITTIEYNRSTHTWQLTGEIGELLGEWPAGPDGRHAATITQLNIEAPEAATLALNLETRIPRLNGRAVRACELIARDKIADGGRPNRWRVKGTTNPHWVYTVHELSPRAGAGYRWHCTCPDWINGESGASNGAPWINHGEIRSPTCKHILAVLIHEELKKQWPPACPECSKSMVIRRQHDDGSGLPFWSCANFPHCRGRKDFTTHPDDRKTARNAREARILSMERAQAAGLVMVAAGAKRRARRRELDQAAQAYRQATDNGEDPTLAAEIADATIMTFEEWRSHHRAQA